LNDITRLTKKYSHILLILFFSLLTVAALLKLGNIDISLDTLARVDWFWYTLVFITFYISVIARGIRWQRILNTLGWPVQRGYAIALLTAGWFGSAVLPARAGDIGRIAMLKQNYDIPIAKGLASITAERAMDVFAILTMAVIAVLITLQDKIPPQALQLMIITAVLFGSGLLGLLAMPSLENWLREARFLQQHLPTALWILYSKLIEFGFNLLHGVRDLSKHPATLLLLVGESFLIWIYDMLIIHFTLYAIASPLTIAQSTVAAMLSDLSIAIPLTPGGLGQFELVLIALLALFDLPTSDGALTALLVRFAIFWTFIPISGLVTYLFGFSRVLSWNHQPKPADSASAMIN